MQTKLLFLFILVFVKFSLSGQTNKTDSLIIGKWNLEYKGRKKKKIEHNDWISYTFSNDRYVSITYFVHEVGKWELSGNKKKLTLYETHYSGGDMVYSIPDPNNPSQPIVRKGGPVKTTIEKFTFKIISINANELVLKDNKGKRYYFTRKTNNE